MRGLRGVVSVGAVLLAAGMLAACSAPALGERVLGTWGEGAGVADPHLVFSDDGRVSGSDGCNSLSGSWSVQDDAVVVSDVASTLMACPGVDTWLRGIAQATLSDDGGRLSVTDDTGTRIGTLDRAE